MDGGKLVGYGVDTLVLNVRYTDRDGAIFQHELSEGLQEVLDHLQGQARMKEEAVESPWVFLGIAPVFMEPHGGGKQWRWLLTCPLLKIAVSRGRFNDIIAQVRFASAFLWSQAWCGDALYLVHVFLMSIFGEHLHLQVSEVHLCADVTGYDFSGCDYTTGFVTRVRKNEAVYGADTVAADYRRVSSLAFSRHKSPISAVVYNKTLEIRQSSGKTWFYDLWRKQGWDDASDVWRVECRFKREFLHEVGIEEAYEVLTQFKPLWDYAVGREQGGGDGLPDGWLRYVLPDGEDTNRSRWPAHPAWRVVQGAFSEDADPGLGPLVRQRIAEKNIERGLAATVGYISTLAAWLGGDKAAPDADISTMLHWLADNGPDYLQAKERDFVSEVRKKQRRYASADGESEAA
jgi:hypothetical protein